MTNNHVGKFLPSHVIEDFGLKSFQERFHWSLPEKKKKTYLKDTLAYAVSEPFIPKVSACCCIDTISEPEKFKSSKCIVKENELLRL